MNTAAPQLQPKLVTGAFSIYVFVAVVGHWLLGPEWVWPFATFMLITMTVTYPKEAVLSRQFLTLELMIAMGLSAVAILGLFTTPWLIIASIIAHGLLDFAKGRGFGVPFYRMYLIGCGVFDLAYAAALTVFYLSYGVST